MGLSYLGGKAWTEITREERFFCLELFNKVRANPAPFLALLAAQAAAPLPSGPWEIAYEACFYRDLLKHRGQRRPASRGQLTGGALGFNPGGSAVRTPEDDIAYPTVSYEYSRLCFRAEIIEPLGNDDSFRVITPEGSFQMTKREFYSSFHGVTRTRSYRERGLYHFPRVPRYAEPFRLEITKKRPC